MEYEVLFKTRHGSHLYGLNHAASDEDFYTVVDRPRGRRYKYAKQTIHDGEDSLTINLPTWLRICEKGVPQALEAMFAPNPLVDNIPWLRAAYRAGSGVRQTYARTITNFVMDGTFKRKRHAVRLGFNLRDIGRYGRFNPVLNESQKVIANTLATVLEGEELLERIWRISYGFGSEERPAG